VTAKRFMDLLGAVLGLVIVALPGVAVALCIKLDSRGPVFFRQNRVGQFGREFRIFKFRTMTEGERDGAPQLTVGTDARITRCGAFLRRFKIDELPQLLNVLVGDMSLVGPRPEVPRYVATYPAGVRAIVFSVRPGITDAASIVYRGESELLSRSEDPERTYVEEILPAKLDYCVKYVQSHSLIMDLRIIGQTIIAIVRKNR
jgi:lipopolysaccharide/colanic/teichoic acid biosynthesis glycosyltransferase